MIGNDSKNGIITYIDETTATGNVYYGVKAQSASLTVGEGVSAPVDQNLNLEKVYLGDIEQVIVSDNTFPQETVKIQWNPISSLYGDEIKYDFQYSYDQVEWISLDTTIDKEDKVIANLPITRETGKVYYQIQAKNNIGESTIYNSSFSILSFLGEVNNFIAVGDFIAQNKVKFIWNNVKIADVSYELQLSNDGFNWTKAATSEALDGVNSSVEIKLPIYSNTYYFRIKATTGDKIGYSPVLSKFVYAYLGNYRDLKINGQIVSGPSYVYHQDYADITWKAMSYGGKTINYFATISYDMVNFVPARSNSSNTLRILMALLLKEFILISTISKIYVLLEATVDNAYARSDIIEIYMRPELLLADEVVKYLINEQKAMITQMGIFK